MTSGVVTEKADDQLFSLDAVGDLGITRRELKKQKILKVDEILNARSAIPAVSSKKRYPNDIVTDGVVPEKRKRSNWVSHKELQKLKKIAYGNSEVAVAKKDADAKLHDPWEVREPEKQDPRFSFLEKAPEIKPPVTLKIAPISLSMTGMPLPAVKVPEGGVSYNPHFEEWDELLRKEGEKEVEAVKKLMQEQQEEKERLERIAHLEAEEAAKELAETENDNHEEEDEENEVGSKETFVRRRAVRKTRVQKNKEKRRKEEELLKSKLLQQKWQRQQLGNLRAIKREIEAKEMARLESMAATANVTNDPERAEKIRRRRLGKARYLLAFFLPLILFTHTETRLPPKPLELQLPDELTDSLRRLKPEGNLLKERFRSFMERGILETRIMPVIAKKKKITFTEKWSYKDFK